MADVTPESASTTFKRLKKPYELARLVGIRGKNAVLDLVLPPTCRLCNQPVGREQDFCGPCERSLTLSEPMMQSACHRCGRPRPKTQSATERGGASAAEIESCIQCEREKLAFSRALPLWSYQDRVCEAIVAAKYGHQSPLGAALGQRLGRKLVMTLGTDLPDLLSPGLVTFVPSHFTRHFQRGGNGNRAIAEAVCSCLREKNHGVRCRSLLRMTRRIKKQAWLNNEQRHGNVSGAFALKKSYVFAKLLVDQHILLVDDVLTTGATASEVASVLLAGGARSVTLAVVARAIRSQ